MRVLALTILIGKVVIDMCMLSCIEVKVYIVVNYNLELCDTQVGEIECVGRQSEPKYMVQLA